MPLRFVFFYQGFKLQPREQLQQLRKNAAYSIQAEVSDSEDWFFSGNPNPKYRSSAQKLIWTGVVGNRPHKHQENGEVGEEVEQEQVTVGFPGVRKRGDQELADLEPRSSPPLG